MGKIGQLIMGFLEDECETGDSSYNILKRELYDHYATYCEQKGYQKFSEEQFFRQLYSLGLNLEQYRSTFKERVHSQIRKTDRQSERRLRGIRMATITQL